MGESRAAAYFINTDNKKGLVEKNRVDQIEEVDFHYQTYEIVVACIDHCTKTIHQTRSVLYRKLGNPPQSLISLPNKIPTDKLINITNE